MDEETFADLAYRSQKPTSPTADNLTEKQKEDWLWNDHYLRNGLYETCNEGGWPDA